MPKNFFAVVSLLAVLTLTLLGCGGGGGGNGSSDGTTTTIDLTGGDGSATLPSGVYVLAEGPSGGELVVRESISTNLGLNGVQGLRQFDLSYSGPSGSVAIGLAAPKTLATGNVNPESLFFLEQDGSSWQLMRGGTSENGGFAKQFYTSSNVATAFLRSVSSTDERETTAVVGGRLVLAGVSDALSSLHPNDPDADYRPGLRRLRTVVGSSLDVVYVHGWTATPETWQSFDEFAKGSSTYRDKIEPWTFGYQSWQGIAVSAEMLGTALRDAYARGDFDRLVLVGHSMGGLVARTAVLLAAEDSEEWLEAVEVVYLIGTPNQGSPLAAMYTFFESFLKGIWSPHPQLGRFLSVPPSAAGVNDLQVDSEFLQIINGYSLNMPVVTIAGDKSSLDWAVFTTPFVSNPDDGLVSTSSALAPGLFSALDSRIFPDYHSGLILPASAMIDSTDADVVYLRDALANQVSAYPFKLTIRWDTDNTDVDLHLWDPLDRHIYWNNLETGTARLDFDDRDGRGPENLIVYRPTLPGVYPVAVNYFEDRGIGSTWVDLSVTLNPGGEWDVTTTISHRLEYEDFMSLPVRDSGPSWWRPCDIYVDETGRAEILSPDTSRWLESLEVEEETVKSPAEERGSLRARLGL